MSVDEGLARLRLSLASTLGGLGGPELRLPDHAHTSRPWRIHQLAPDFSLEDVWALPTPGSRDDFRRLVDNFVSGDPAEEARGLSRLLWDVRWKLGALLDWDDAAKGLGARVPSLRDRLPADLRSQAGPAFQALPLRCLYLLDDEFAAEIANKTVHGVLHLGWVEDGAGGYRGQMAVLVKPNGRLGAAYMLAIRPFRHLIVYPSLLSDLERDWSARSAQADRRMPRAGQQPAARAS